MELKWILLLPILMFTQSILSQDKLENGRYISADKLINITIMDGFQFEYISYEAFSPYTVKENPKNKSQIPGTVGYWSDGLGNGTYSIDNGKLSLKFELDYTTIASKKIDAQLLKGLTLDIDELKKLETEE